MSMRAPPKSNKPKNRRHESAGDKLIAQSAQLQNKLVLEVTQQAELRNRVMWNGQFNEEYEEAAEEIIADFQKDVRTNLFLAQMLGEGDGPDTKARRDLFSGPMSRRRFHQGVDEEDSDEGVEEALRVADRKFSEDIAVVVRLMNKFDDDAVISELYWYMI